MHGLSFDCLFATLCLMSVLRVLVAGLNATVTPNCGTDGDENGNITIVSDVLLSVTASCSNGVFFFNNNSNANFDITVSYNPLSTETCAFRKSEEDNTYYVLIAALRRDTWTEEFSVTCVIPAHNNQQGNVIEGIIEKQEGESILQITDILGRVIKSSMLTRRKIIQLTLNVTNIPGAVGVKPYSCDAIGVGGQPHPILRDGCSIGGLFRVNEGFVTSGRVSRSPYFQPFNVGRYSSLEFQCNITVCTTACDGSTCLNNRRKRSEDVAGDEDAKQLEDTSIAEPTSSGKHVKGDNSQGDTHVSDTVTERQNDSSYTTEEEEHERFTEADGDEEFVKTTEQFNSSYADILSPEGVGSVKRVDDPNVIGDIVLVNSSTAGVEQIGDSLENYDSVTKVEQVDLSGSEGDLTIISSSVVSSDVISDIQRQQPSPSSSPFLREEQPIREGLQDEVGNVMKNDSSNDIDNYKDDNSESNSSVIGVRTDTISLNVSTKDETVNEVNEGTDSDFNSDIRHEGITSVDFISDYSTVDEHRKTDDASVVSVESESFLTNASSSNTTHVDDASDVSDNSYSEILHVANVPDDNQGIYSTPEPPSGNTRKGQLPSDSGIVSLDEQQTTSEKNSSGENKIIGIRQSKFAVGVVVVSLFALSFLGIWIAHCRKPRPES